MKDVCKVDFLFEDILFKWVSHKNSKQNWEIKFRLLKGQKIWILWEKDEEFRLLNDASIFSQMARILIVVVTENMMQLNNKVFQEQPATLPQLCQLSYNLRSSHFTDSTL